MGNDVGDSAAVGCETCRTSSNGPVSAQMLVSDSAALVWQCPSCGFAWPRFENGDRGEMARAASRRLNGEGFDGRSTGLGQSVQPVPA